MENGTEQHHCAPVVSSLVRSTYPIVVRNAYKSYWQRKSETRVLADLNLSIPQGTIYGLLGPSGCGKTTLLRCIVGRLHLDKGLILTLGQTPGTPQSGIPGPRIGFMPQEEALDGILTIKELFHYFGCIMGVHKKEMKKKAKFLCDFLKLPSKNSLFSTLSGGQKRRVSFAVTLIHDAELYILDEPTVGVDPILKQSIWNYLFQLVEGGKKTVIITTHYIEEARGANFVGMMFDGRLLAEGPPERLIELYNKSTLEDVFLDICQMQKNNNSERVRRENVEDFNNTIPLLVNGDALNDRATSTVDEAELCEVKSIRKDSVHLQNPSGVFKFCPDIQWMKLNAIIQRNFIQLFRYPGLFLLIMVLPSIQVAMCNFAIGRFILSINLGVVNHDNGHLAQGFLSRLDNRIIEQINFSDFDVARSAAKNGQTRGVLSFDQDFSYSIVERFNKTPFVSQEVLRKSTINLSLDGTSFIFAETVRVVLLTTYEKFLSDILVVNNMDPNMGILPIIYDKPIYGKNEDEYISFIMPGFIAAAAFFSQLGLSVIALFLDRDGGKLERIYTAGVTSFEMIFGFLVLQVVVVMAQTTLMLVLTFVVLEYDNDGSIFMIIAMTISQGICGITLGLLVASITDTFMSAAAVSVTILITSAALGGFFWPIEAMPSFIKAICSWLPFAPAANSFRHMMYRGWSLFHGDILTAFGVTYGWTLLLLLSAIVIVRLRKGT